LRLASLVINDQGFQALEEFEFKQEEASTNETYLGCCIVLLPCDCEGGIMSFTFDSIEQPSKITMPQFGSSNGSFSMSQFPLIAVPKGTKCTIDRITSGTQAYLKFGMYGPFFFKKC